MTEDLKRHDVFAYRDTGVPNNSNGYTTFVIIHGFSWHGGIFRRMLPFAKQYDSRLVVLNRRDYPGSKAFDPTELEFLEKTGTEAAAGLQYYMRARALELSQFLYWFVNEHKIPKLSDDGKKGGLAVIGWSSGNHLPVSLLESARTFDINMVKNLELYLHRIIIYDPPLYLLGYPRPEQDYSPLFDRSLAPGLALQLFQKWVSGYFNHTALKSGVQDVSMIEYREPLEDPSPTILRMSEADIAANCDPTPTVPGGSESFFTIGMQQGLFRPQAQAVLIDEDFAERGIWPKVQIRYIWCDHSTWEVCAGLWSLQAEVGKALEAGKVLRPIRFERFEGANHFAHWDMPEETLKTYLKCVHD